MGGPPVVTPKRRGFGSRVVESLLEAEISDRAKFSFRLAGFAYEVVAPLAGLVEEPR